MNRIVLAGDTHGVLTLDKVFNYQQTKNKLDMSDYLIICGDCGVVWDEDILGSIIEKYNSIGTNILFVDGNHENFDLLNSYPVETWNGGKVHKIAENIIHLMRGQVFEIFGKKILTLGGACSTDKAQRTEHFSWWADEEFSEHDLQEALRNLKKHQNKVDFVISHSPTDDLIELLKAMYTQCGEDIPWYLKIN